MTDEKDEAEQKAIYLLNEIADMAWPAAVNLIAAALREAHQAAYVRGLERAIELSQPHEIERAASNRYRCDFILGLVIDRIQAEIDKASKP
jgi:hypothetical protein